MSISEEQIAAYADGELDGAPLAKMEAAIAADPEIGRKVEAHRALKGRLAGHYAPLLDDEMPASLTDLLKAGKGEEADATEAPAQAEVVSFAAARQKRGLAPAMRRWGVYIGPAMAAALVAAVIIAPGGGDSDPIPGSPSVGPQLAAALDTQLAGEQVAGSEHRILLSFADGSDNLCRVYRSARAGGIACNKGTGWQIEEQMMLGEAQATQFRQAGSSESDLLARAQEMAEGGALDAEQEARARASGWR
ncbi:anti-sigma factor family protein [Qipengyuania nanhaisediminis]|uniref:anti-sigma factor family protein n=1 Tax=Qipengyuania nanhaisediminis TaxID=604088 RepID=UPI0038B33211